MPINVEHLLAELERRVQLLEELSRRVAVALGQPRRRESRQMQANGGKRHGFEVVFVCSGNRFRSPLAEASLKKLTEGLPVRVSSLGTLDLGPKPVMSEALDLASDLDLDLSRHRARPLMRENLEGADLVIGFERPHVSMAVVEAGAAPERTFTMLELVDLLEWIDPPATRDPLARARDAVAQLDEARSLRLPATAPELADPIGASARVHRDTAGKVWESTRALAEVLFGVRHAAARPVPTFRGLLRRR